MESTIAGFVTTLENQNQTLRNTLRLLLLRMCQNIQVQRLFKESSIKQEAP